MLFGLPVCSANDQELVPLAPAPVDVVAGRGALCAGLAFGFDRANCVDLFCKMAPMVRLVEASLPLNCENWVDVLAQLYEVSSLVSYLGVLALVVAGEIEPEVVGDSVRIRLVRETK